MRDAACAIHGSSDTRQTSAPSDDRAPGGDPAAPLNVVVLDLAYFYELRFSIRFLISASTSM